MSARCRATDIDPSSPDLAHTVRAVAEDCGASRTIVDAFPPHRIQMPRQQSGRLRSYVTAPTLITDLPFRTRPSTHLPTVQRPVPRGGPICRPRSTASPTPSPTISDAEAPGGHANVGEEMVTDITYVRVTSGFAYTAFVTDLFSRKIVGWSTRSGQVLLRGVSGLCRALPGRADCPAVIAAQGGIVGLGSAASRTSCSVAASASTAPSGLQAARS